MFKVTFSFEDGSVVEHFANAGDNLLELAREANVAIDAPCSGNASCGKCRVQLKKGELDSKKTLHISEEEYQEGWRLACTSKICADVTVLVPDIASAYKSRMKVADLSSKEEIAIFENSKRDVEMTGIELRNSLDVIELDMNEPSLDDTMPDNERLTRALKKYMNLKQVRIPYAVLRKLPDVLRENHFKVKCVVRTAPNDLFVYDIFGKDEEVVVGRTCSGYWYHNCFCSPDQHGDRRDSCQGFLWETDRSVSEQMLSTVSSNSRSQAVRRNCRMQSLKRQSIQ